MSYLYSNYNPYGNYSYKRGTTNVDNYPLSRMQRIGQKNAEKSSSMANKAFFADNYLEKAINAKKPLRENNTLLNTKYKYKPINYEDNSASKYSNSVNMKSNFDYDFFRSTGETKDPLKAKSKTKKEKESLEKPKEISSKKTMSYSYIDRSPDIYSHSVLKDKNYEIGSTYIGSSSEDSYGGYDSTANKIFNSEVGLQNLGNTCFMNTCLQILLHSPPFISQLYKLSSSVHLKPITSSFLSLGKKMASSGYGAISPSEFKREYNMRRRDFAGYGQHDTLEFCRFLLDDISKELNKGNPRAPYKELKTEGKSKLVCNKEYDDYLRTKEDSLIVDIFYGQLVSTYTCRCGTESYSFQKFLDLPLLFTSRGSQNVSDMLDLYFKDERIKWESKCEGCKQKTEHRKQLRISILPEILILSLQRFNARTGSKNNERVSFDQNINLDPYVDRECSKGRSSYSLYGIANHSGTPSFGHYYAYAKVNGSWKEYNDSTVSSYSVSSSTSSGYVLFYMKDK
ncbi:MAG: ubiquitin carboxyl-terminal hydrolase [archaeon]|nr:ubiquitin carboxyl-terminal hydrolase [archaeon]